MKVLLPQLSLHSTLSFPIHTAALTTFLNPHLSKCLVFVVSNNPPSVFSLVRKKTFFLNEFLASSKDPSHLATPRLWGSVSSHPSVSSLPWNHLFCPGPRLDVVPQDVASVCSWGNTDRSSGPLFSELVFAVELWLTSC